jgi:hypothetical protein
MRDDMSMQTYANVTWLIPLASAPARHTFDAAHFALGAHDDTAYALDQLQFVMSGARLPMVDSKWRTARVIQR